MERQAKPCCWQRTQPGDRPLFVRRRGSPARPQQRSTRLVAERLSDLGLARLSQARPVVSSSYRSRLHLRSRPSWRDSQAPRRHLIEVRTDWRVSPQSGKDSKEPSSTRSRNLRARLPEQREQRTARCRRRLGAYPRAMNSRGTSFCKADREQAGRAKIAPGRVMNQAQQLDNDIHGSIR